VPSRPDAGIEAVKRVVGELQRVRVVGEGGDGKDQASVGDAGLSTGKLPAARAGDGLTSAASWSAR